MKRKQTRYESEQLIIDRIDATKSKLLALRKEAEALDQTKFYERLKDIDAKCRRIEDTTLPKLKNALAAFRTETMPFCGDDKAVVL